MKTGMPKPSRDALFQLFEGTRKCRKIEDEERGQEAHQDSRHRKGGACTPRSARHRQHSRPKKMKRQARGPEIINESDARGHQEDLSCPTASIPNEGSAPWLAFKRGVTSHAVTRRSSTWGSGYFGRSSTNYRIALERVEKALQYAYRDGRNKKRDFPPSGSSAINCRRPRHNGLTYSQSIRRHQEGPASPWTAR
jgi:ribosomal protein L20